VGDYGTLFFIYFLKRLDFSFLILIFVQTISGTCPKLGQLSARHSEHASFAASTQRLKMPGVISLLCPDNLVSPSRRRESESYGLPRATVALISYFLCAHLPQLCPNFDRPAL
jgi:hypothetical protein